MVSGFKNIYWLLTIIPETALGIRDRLVLKKAPLGHLNFSESGLFSLGMNLEYKLSYIYTVSINNPLICIESLQKIFNSI